jgi:hypothetical protein
MRRPNGLAFSCRERARRRLQKTNDLAREAVNCNAVFGGSRVSGFLVKNIPLFIYLPQPQKDRQITPSTCTQLLDIPTGCGIFIDQTGASTFQKTGYLEVIPSLSGWAFNPKPEDMAGLIESTSARHAMQIADLIQDHLLDKGITIGNLFSMLRQFFRR